MRHDCLLIGLLLVSSLAAAPIPADQWTLGPSAKLHAGSAVAEVAATSQVEDLVSGQTTPLRLEPGTYRAEAVVRAEPLQAYGYRAVLTVRLAAQNPTISGGLYRHDRAILTPRKYETWLGVTTARPMEHDADGLLHLRTEFSIAEATDVQLAVGWAIGEYHVRQLKPPQMPAALDHFELRSLSCDKLDRQAAIDDLTTDKLILKPGGAPRVSAKLLWTGDAETTLDWHVRLTHDLEAPTIAAKGQVTLPSRVAIDWATELPALKDFGGYRADLDLLAGGKVVATAERCFAVSPTYNRIGMYGVGLETNPQPSFVNTPEKLDYVLDWMKRSYLGWYEIGFWAPDDFQGLSPGEENFVSNVYTPQKLSMIQYLCKGGAARGIGVYAYAKGCYADGAEGWGWAQRHPELLLYDADSGQPLGRYDMERLVNQKQVEADVLARKPLSKEWYYALLNPGRPAVVDVAARAMQKSVATFGWSGVRFDGDFANLGLGTAEGRANGLGGTPYAGPDETEANWAACLNRYRAKMQAACPGFEIGCNYGFLDIKGDLTAVAAMARDDGMVMNEMIRSHQHPQDPHNRWDDFARAIVHDSRRIRQLGGWYQCIGSYAMRADDYLYQSVYTLAAQAKPYGPYFFDTPFANRLPRYITRFAGIFCGDQYPVPGAVGKVSVSASAELDWQRYVNFLEPGPNRRRYVIQLINPPLAEQAMSEHGRTLLRPTVTEVKVTLGLDPGERVEGAWQLDPWLEQDALPAKVTSQPGAATFELPHSVSIWSTLVIDCSIDPEAY